MRLWYVRIRMWIKKAFCQHGTPKYDSKLGRWFCPRSYCSREASYDMLYGKTIWA